MEATWTKKHGVSHYGYKNHVTVDRQYKLVRDYETTTASTHDSPVLTRILRPDKDDGRVWGDGAYRSQALEELKKRGHRSRIHSKGYRNHPLTTHQKYVNRLRSRVRVRVVEHVFGSMVNEMKRTRMRCIGQQRAATWTGLCTCATTCAGSPSCRPLRLPLAECCGRIAPKHIGKPRENRRPIAHFTP